jgi:hypothetical protein
MSAFSAAFHNSDRNYQRKQYRSYCGGFRRREANSESGLAGWSAGEAWHERNDVTDERHSQLTYIGGGDSASKGPLRQGTLDLVGVRSVKKIDT